MIVIGDNLQTAVTVAKDGCSTSNRKWIKKEESRWQAGISFVFSRKEPAFKQAVSSIAYVAIMNDKWITKIA